jgi:hypothetical protein
MAHALADDTPEHMIEVLNRRRILKTIGVVGGLIVAIVVMIGAAAAMYSKDYTGGKPAPAAPR